MKSVYVDDMLHQRLKKLAQESDQTLLSLLNQLIQEGLERMEKNRYHAHSPTLDPVGMFGTLRRQTVEVETDFQRDRYQGIGEENGRF